MNSQMILRALRAKEISPEDAKKALAETNIVSDQFLTPQKDGLSSSNGQNNNSVQIHLPNKELVPQVRSAGKKDYSESPVCKDTIAIVGMSGRYPGASDLHQYWRNLVNARNLIKEVPSCRWDVNQYYDPRPSQKGKAYCKWLGLLEDIEYFDPLFFNISPIEAELMDPQHRIFLQEGYKAFEDAGYSRQLLSNKKCGVYVGIMSNEYGMMLYKHKGGAANTTGGSFAIAAARLAYHLNLKGPAIPIDTACSSSLVATHLACQALSNEEIDMALVGGVSLYLAPESYIGMCAAGMLAPDGQCKTFDNSADGFVPGEGAGALVLKRLKDAELDNDVIYGVIIGSGINQDGKTNGITAPSGKSQMELAREIYDKYKIDPETISYAEMHGTGTKLGDPIELEALSTAIKEKTNQKNYCAIGSVKSNIGHTSAAAGAASMQKVLLCLKNKQLVPTLNFSKHNEHFNFADSPFYVNTELRPWEAAAGVPRRAVVSAFGFSGTNAHLVIEEYLPKLAAARTPIPLKPSNPVLFVLSAQTDKQLKIYVENMKDWLEAQEEINLEDMAYTLQAGREAMDYRLACLADSRESLCKMLEKFIDNHPVTGLLTGQGKKSTDGVAGLADDEDVQVLLQNWIQKRKLNKIADLWVKGLNIDWNGFYGDRKPRRISLPTYPFAKERYWALESKAEAVNTVTATPAVAGSAHPLLQENTSDLSEQRFTSTFSGREFFLADHRVKEQRILPGVACLEMARAAVKQAAGTLAKGQTGILLKNVVWIRPIVVGEQPVQIHIQLFPADNGEIVYEIYSESEGDNKEPIVHSQGIAMLSSLAEAPVLDLPALQAQCARNTFTPIQCYEAFKQMGIEYGPGYQGIEHVHAGHDQVLAKLSLPSSISDTKDQFILHPSLLDAALQASIGLMLVSDDMKVPLQPTLPFALQTMEIITKCSSVMWAWIRYSGGSKSGDKVQKFDIDLCDEQGNVCTRMKGFSARILTGELDPGGSPASPGTLMLHPCWEEQAVAREVKTPAYTQHMVLLCERGKISRRSIENQINGVGCLSLESGQNDIGERFRNYAVQAFEEIQNILDKPMGRVLVQIVVFPRDEQQLFSGLSGILKTARLENPKLIGQLIEVEAGEDAEGLAEKLQDNSRSPLDSHIRYQDGKRYVAGWKEIDASKETAKIPWKDGGCYLITGGVGGLGLIFAKEIAQKVKNATLILTGRSALTEAKEAKIKELAALGARIDYKQVDINQKQAVDDLFHTIQEDFSSLHGIIHSAGVIKDNFIRKKSKEEVQEVLMPKVTGLVNLDQASKDLSLDFIVFFSSTAGAFGNPGQADYATANAFMDAYAKYRNALVASKLRQGRTLSVNWPLWKEGGMHVDAETEKMIREKTGISAIETTAGIHALYQGLASGRDQVLVAGGDVNRLRTALMERQSGRKSIKAISATAENRVLPVGGQDLLREKSINFFKKLFSSTIKLPAQRIEADAPLEKYGIDSIMITQLTYQLEKIFGPLSKTLFLEYKNIRELTGYFLEFYQDKLMGLLGIEEKAPAFAPYGKESITMTAPIEPTLSISKRNNIKVSQLSPEQKSELSKKILVEKVTDSKAEPKIAQAENGNGDYGIFSDIPEEYYRVKLFPDYLELSSKVELFALLQIPNPSFRVNESIINNTTRIDGREYISYSSYNYLGFSGDERVTQAANEAIERYGTSVSASRGATGEKPIHGELEADLAGIIGTEACIVYVGGHSANVSTISCLLRPQDLVVCDALSHNSIIQGCILSGARRIMFPHNDWEGLEDILKQNRGDYERTLIVVEGVYSMDGDIANLPRFVELKKRYKAMLMVDEAHSMGVLGKNGRGIVEYFGTDPRDVDVWMGTLSKTFASCGGYIAGSKELIQLLKHSAGGFVYSVGITPANAGAALAAARLLRTETDRVVRLQKNSRFFLELAQENGLNTGLSKDSAVVPVIVGDSMKSIKLANDLFQHGINVHPIIYPAVADGEARLRFFITCDHTEDQMSYTIKTVRESLNKLG
jgi:polyketide synthase PksN